MKIVEGQPRPMKVPDKAIEAARCFLSRQYKLSTPNGQWVNKKNSKVWYPDYDLERSPCCKKVRKPTPANPAKLYNHCRSKHHVCQLYEVTVKELSWGIEHIKVELKLLGVDLSLPLNPRVQEVLNYDMAQAFKVPSR